MDNNEQLINELSLLRKAAERIADALENIDETLEAMVFEDDSDLDELLAGLEDEDYDEFDEDEFEDEEEEEGEEE